MDQAVTAPVAAYDIRSLAFSVGKASILSGITISVSAGEVLLVAGPSGSGKSTFLKLLVRLLEPTSGTIHVFGDEIHRIGPPLLRRKAAYVPQIPALGPVPVQENLRLGAVFARRDVDGDRVAHLLNTVRLPTDYALRNTRSLSGGEQYRLSLAMALALERKALLLDEPTASLDPELADHMAFLIRELTESSTSVIVVTHDMHLVKGLTGTYLFLEDGKAQASGSLGDFDHDGDSRALWRRLTTSSSGE